MNKHIKAIKVYDMFKLQELVLQAGTLQDTF